MSGPLLDRIDLILHVPPVRPSDLALPPRREAPADVAARGNLWSAVPTLMGATTAPAAKRCRSAMPSFRALLAEVAEPDADGWPLLTMAAERLRLSARGWHRVLRAARTLADFDAALRIRRLHVAEALS